ncbi:hypothetical protein [Acinetobacter pittii]|nr:hypothetical protein [Acinetobacter pittii]
MKSAERGNSTPLNQEVEQSHYSRQWACNKITSISSSIEAILISPE